MTGLRLIGLAFQVARLSALRPEEAVMDRQLQGHKAITDEIEHSPREATDCFEHRALVPRLGKGSRGGSGPIFTKMPFKIWIRGDRG